MKSPVVNSVGQTYDKESIEKWISMGNTTGPNTRQEIEITIPPRLIPNFSVKQLIEVYNEINNYLQQSGGERKYKKNNKKQRNIKKQKK